MRAGNRSGVACDWWANAERDFDLARDLGLNRCACRSTGRGWSRRSAASTTPRSAATARWSSALRERGLEPMVCLHHFDQPVWLEDMGGFENPASVELFVRFARRVVEALGDVCREWLTFNEPNVYSTVGYVIGDFPPGPPRATRSPRCACSATWRAHTRARTR